jgi:hypothetical protein
MNGSDLLMNIYRKTCDEIVTGYVTPRGILSIRKRKTSRKQCYRLAISKVPFSCIYDVSRTLWAVWVGYNGATASFTMPGWELEVTTIHTTSYSL